LPRSQAAGLDRGSTLSIHGAYPQWHGVRDDRDAGEGEVLSGPSRVACQAGEQSSHVGEGSQGQIGRASCRERMEVPTACRSTKRRHTRFSRDWSSAVCSSDLFHDLKRRAWTAEARSAYMARTLSGMEYETTAMPAKVKSYQDPHELLAKLESKAAMWERVARD